MIQNMETLHKIWANIAKVKKIYEAMSKFSKLNLN